MLVALLSRPASAAENLAYDGDPAPDTGSGVYAFDVDSVQVFPSPARMDAAGNVTFSTGVVGGSVSVGVFRTVGSTVTPLALPGDPAPDTGGGTFSEFSWAPGTVGVFFDVSGDGEVAFFAQVSGGTVASGAFASDGTTTRAVALEGGAAPGGGTWSGISAPLAINRSGEVLLGATLDGTFGLYVHSGSSLSTIAAQGGPAPGTGGATYRLNLFPFTDMNDDGEVAFVAKLSGGTTDAGLFLHSGGSVSALAVEGDPVPGIPGATFRCVLLPYCSFPCSNDFTHPAFGWPAMNEDGVVAFQGFAETGPSCGDEEDGIFLASGGTISPVAVAGGSAPAGLGTFRDFRFFSRIDLNRRAEVVFSAVTDGDTIESGIFVRRSSGIEVVKLGQGIAPGTGGAEFSGFGVSPTLDASGTRFAEIVSTWDGQDVAFGLFRFATPGVPSLQVPGLLALALALAWAVRSRLARRS